MVYDDDGNENVTNAFEEEVTVTKKKSPTTNETVIRVNKDLVTLCWLKMIMHGDARAHVYLPSCIYLVVIYGNGAMLVLSHLSNHFHPTWP